MRTISGPAPSKERRGFTLIEVTLALVVGLLALGGVVQLLIVQGRGYRKQREVVDVRQTAREASALLSWDLRQAAAGGSRIVALSANSLTIRSPRGVGTICGKHPVLARYALWKSGGSIQATADDTALVYQMGRDKWSKLKIAAVGTPAAMGVPACAWPGARPPDMVVELVVTSKWDTATIKVGAPFRSFRQVQYAEYQDSNRWWLGRKVGDAASFEQLTGPLLDPGAGGLAFTYYDTLGAPTANTAAVGRVAFKLRTESFKQTMVGTGFTYQRDSLETVVALRR